MELIDGACAKDAAAKLPLLEAPEVHDVVVCAHCGRTFTGTSWRELGQGRDQKTEATLRPKLEVDPRLSDVSLKLEALWEDERNAVLTATLTGRLDTEPVERTEQVRVRLKSGACPDCSREMGGYFEATLQIRGSPGTDLAYLLPRIEAFIAERLETFHQEGRPNAFITEMNRLRTGVDYVLGSHEVARILAAEAAERWGAEQDESTKLFTRKDGRDVYRWTMLVRLPPYARGDFLLIDEKPYKLGSFDKRTLHLIDLKDRRPVRREVRRTTFKVVGRAHDQRDAIVVSRSGRFVQVLDPVTFKTIDVPAAHVPESAQTVPVFKFEDHLYVVVDKA